MREVIAVHTKIKCDVCGAEQTHPGEKGSDLWVKISEEPGEWAPEYPAVTKDLCIKCLPKVRKAVLAAIQSLIKEQG